jgi:hypothetical protein
MKIAIIGAGADRHLIQQYRADSEAELFLTIS